MFGYEHTEVHKATVAVTNAYTILKKGQEQLYLGHIAVSFQFMFYYYENI